MRKRALLNLTDIFAALANDVLSLAMDILKRWQTRVLNVRVKVKERQTTE